MKTLNLVYPALALILWAFVVMVIMFLRRRRAFLDKQVRFADVAVSGERYPEPARLAASNFSNQFETPVLFYALIMLAMTVNATNYLMTALAWGFVATRVVHTLIHVGANDLRLRAIVFTIGVALLFGMWLGIVLTLV